MKVTVCQLEDRPEALERDWRSLAAHVRREGSDLVLLPEMPFHPWIAATRRFDPEVWRAAVEAHARWSRRLEDLAPATVVATRPVNHDGKRRNEGFVWEIGEGARRVHEKHYLPDEPGFWEASWYERGEREFEPARVRGASIGMLICTEMWFTEHCRDYARAGVHLLACPRAVGVESVSKWVAGGRTAAVMAGAYGLSSNRCGTDARGAEWGGAGWIIEPDEGEVLALTSAEQPFVTREIDLAAADAAKSTYPRDIYTK